MSNKYNKALIISNRGGIIYRASYGENPFICRVQLPETLRGFRGIDFEIQDAAFTHPGLKECLDILVLNNMGTEFESKSLIYRLLYG